MSTKIHAVRVLSMIDTKKEHASVAYGLVCSSIPIAPLLNDHYRATFVYCIVISFIGTTILLVTLLG